MSAASDWLERAPAIGKWIAGVVAGLAATVAGWTSLGMPVPASRQWVQSHYEEQQRQQELARDIRELEALLDKVESEDVREGLEARLAELRSRREG